MLIMMNNEEIKRKVFELGGELMLVNSHGYEKYPNWKIIDAAKDQAEIFKNPELKIPAIVIMDVVLAANRNYEKQVKGRVQDLYKNFPTLTFDALNEMLEVTHNSYERFQSVWGHKDEKKFNTLKNIVAAIMVLKENAPDLNDMQIMKKWAENASTLCDRKIDSIGKIKNVGIATFQHLQLVFGIDTVKPDQRVKEVLQKEFKLQKLSSQKAIDAVKEIAIIMNYDVRLIDQIFVKYGSGYYAKNPEIK